MSSETITKRETPRKAFATVLRTAGLLAALALLSTATAHAYSWYSGASVGSNGTVYGWGVTDGTAPPPMLHLAYVTTTLTSPVQGRQAYLSSGGQQNMARVDVSLPFDPADSGTFAVHSVSNAYCYWGMAAFIYNAASQASTTVPEVILGLQNSGSVSANNSAAHYYSFDTGTLNLTTLQASSDHRWATGVQIVGFVYPISYTGSITIKREKRNEYVYKGCTVEGTPITTPVPDTSIDAARDDNPQHGGIVYDLDAPGIKNPPGSPVGRIARRRTNFRQWAVLSGTTTIVSFGDLYWYTRVSVERTSTGDVLRTDMSGDNIAAGGVTPTTCDLR